MRFDPVFTGSSPELDCPPFPASVPGNIQADFIKAHPEFIRDINFGLEHRRMTELEPLTWIYKTTLDYTLSPGEKLWFVTEGIDYVWFLLLDGEEFYAHEGMFSRVELCLTDLLGERLRPGAEFAVKIHPHPMREGAPFGRAQADMCVKPPVSYGWDWHPRAIPSGIWDDTYFETRGPGHIDRAEVRYILSPDLTRADVFVDADTRAEALFRMYAPDGSLIYEKTAAPGALSLVFSVRDPVLWQCRGMGEPALYTWEVRTADDVKTGTVGFRRVRLVMNAGAWREPVEFPKTRSVPPAQIELNGRRVFAKGSNYVNQEIFTGTLTRERYEEAVRDAAACNMNIFRCWGGSGIQKEDFYDLCDRYGIMVWAEFPLACNEYRNDSRYLAVLRQEAEAIVKKLRWHPCVVLFCGGNELFNSWSRMTDQHLALRLLNAVTLEQAPEIPFIPTSPLFGMKHGGYTFLDRMTGLDPYALFGSTKATAYTEFGLPGIPSADYLRSVIPPEELFPPKPGENSSWQAHHAFDAWGPDAWLCLPTLERFGDVSSLEAMAETSAWLQRTGYKAVFEAARRQKPYCSMAVNWCWCEPWKCAVNNSLIAYPDVKKDAYYAVRDSLRDVLGAAEIPKFAWAPGETLTLEPWLLNDSPDPQAGRVTLTVTVNGETHVVGSAELSADPLSNARGGPVTFTLPDGIPSKTRFTVTAVLEQPDGRMTENVYELVIEAKEN